MRWYQLLGWALCLWLTAGMQAAWGGGPPGPVLLVAVMAGLWSGITAGLLVGAVAGLCDAALCGGNITHWVFLGMLAGSCGSAFPRWFSRRHPLVGMGAAALMTLVACVFLGITHALPAGESMRFALMRAAFSALWVIPIYGIVLLVSLRGSNTLPRWER